MSTLEQDRNGASEKTSSTGFRVVACIPAHNEEQSIARVILRVQGLLDHVIVCDDGSTDLTGLIAERLGAIVVKHQTNMGYGSALRLWCSMFWSMSSEKLVRSDAMSFLKRQLRPDPA